MTAAAADPARAFRKLARANALANFRLHRACLLLEPGEFEAPRTGFFPSLKATLNHILVIDRFYIDAMLGGTLGEKAWEDSEPCATVAALAAEQAKSDRLLLDLVNGLTPARLGETLRIHRRVRVQEERMDDVLSHLLQHQTHHRGQAHAMLSGSSVRPPQLDEFIVADDAAARRAELAALGWSERDLEF